VPLNKVEFSPDGTRFAGLTLDAITIYDSATLEKAGNLVCICTLTEMPSRTSRSWLYVWVHASQGQCARVRCNIAARMLQLQLMQRYQ
jgi:hypothetical protein